MRHALLGFVALMIVGCTPERVPQSPDGGDSCSASQTRCVGQSYQVCRDGVFTTDATCPSLCVEDVGCKDCDPALGNACSGSNVVACNADGTYGAVVTACGNGMTCQNATCTNVCTADGVDLIYVIDEDQHFMSFDPRLLGSADPFRIIGTLNCPVTGGSIQIPTGPVIPFSMSVDRDGVAWVEYSSGEIFNVSLTTAACTATPYVRQSAGMNLFGMGFVTDGPNTDTEKLYIVGGGQSAEPNGRLGFVDTHNAQYAPQIVGSISASSDFSPELTGTNEGRLYGFYPVLTSAPAYVQEIEKTTGQPIGPQFPLGTTGLGGQIRDWAFAQWGNKFYIFITTQDSLGVRNSTVRSIDKATGVYTIELQNLPYFIPGAGVSTCAPSVLQ
ncbi:MAG TPA: hypothetical protein VFQ53_21170 [Kofleriaceae bacterium]|nr:hypothetical protein [Kofleriaceae bacterium]